MTEIATNNRKRSRSQSNEAPYVLQNKHFINQQAMDRNDQNKMKQIHDKTIQMLFKNANNTNNNGEHAFVDKLEQYRLIRMIGNGIIQPLGGQQISKEAVRSCNYCNKMSVISAADCINCNLELCEFCGVSCSQCNEPLCLACVELFGCNGEMDDVSCCHRCKLLKF